MLVPPRAMIAQPSPKTARIGFLATSSPESPETRELLDAFQQGLRERGYVEGQNIVIEYREAGGRIERLPALASELVRLTPDLIVLSATSAARAALQATAKIPIVASAMGDPVGDRACDEPRATGRECYGIDLSRPGAHAQASGATQGNDSSCGARRRPLAPGRFQRTNDKCNVERVRGRGTDAGNLASLCRSARSRRVRPRILHDVPRARRCPHRVPEPAALS